jgi:hypothetical protein
VPDQLCGLSSQALIAERANTEANRAQPSNRSTRQAKIALRPFRHQLLG